MQEDFDRTNESETKNSERPRQGQGVRTDTGRKENPRDIEPKTKDGGNRKRKNNDDPGRKSALDRSATAKLNKQYQRKDQSGGGAGHAPRH